MGGQADGRTDETDEPEAQWEPKAVAHYLIWFQVVIVNHVSKWEWQRVYVVRSRKSNDKKQRKRKMIKEMFNREEKKLRIPWTSRQYQIKTSKFLWLLSFDDKE